MLWVGLQYCCFWWASARLQIANNYWPFMARVNVFFVPAKKPLRSHASRCCTCHKVRHALLVPFSHFFMFVQLLFVSGTLDFTLATNKLTQHRIVVINSSNWQSWHVHHQWYILATQISIISSYLKQAAIILCLSSSLLLIRNINVLLVGIPLAEPPIISANNNVEHLQKSLDNLESHMKLTLVEIIPTTPSF